VGLRPGYLEWFGDTDEDAMVMAVITQDEDPMVLGQRLLTEGHLVGTGARVRWLPSRVLRSPGQ
jgi:hypothetical protein